MTPTAFPRIRLARLAGTTAMVLTLGVAPAFADPGRGAYTQGCALVAGAVPAGCVQANAGQVIARAVPANTGTAAAIVPGDLGFSISVETPATGGPALTPPTTPPLTTSDIDGSATVPRVAYDISEAPGDPTIAPFATGLIDLTYGRDMVEDESFSRGRIAGFAEGVWSNGVRYTASLDTRDEELRDLFRDFGRKHPDQMLRNIEDDDVWVTTGDDSIAEDLAPTAGKFYLKLEKDRSHILWGDFRPDAELGRVVRSDRTLYGLEGTHRAPEARDTAAGEARYAFTGYVSQPDTLMQRDIFRGTGGSAYFLSRRDIENGTETLLIEVRDPVSNRVIRQRRLIEGVDYRIDYIQGVVILNAPLSPSEGAGGLVSDRPLGDYDVNLVAQYEYVPTTGDVDGIAAGARAEVWATDALRLGITGQTENTGLADNTLAGVDILFRRSAGTQLAFDIARSEGPGFGTSTSLNGGLEIDTGVPSAGVDGRAAMGYRLEGRVDLADYGGRGFVAAYFDEREAGFTSPDQDIEVDQRSFGIEGQVAIGAATDLTFGYDGFSDDAGKRRDDGRVGLVRVLSDTLTLAAEVNHTDRRLPLSTLAEDNGSRTDLGVRLTFARSKTSSVWVFGQATLAKSGGLGSNNRLGAGIETRLSDRLSFTGEASVGDLGGAALAQLVYAPNADTSYSLGYRLDPTRALDSSSMTGADRGSLIAGATSQINEAWRYTAENSYSAFGSEPAMTSAYGVSYAPSTTWAYDAGLLHGRTTETDGTRIDRTGLSLGLRYSGGDQMSGRLRGEYRVEDSTNPARAEDRETFLLAGAYARRTSEDWRLVASLDAVISRADSGSVRDGDYVEAKVGYAYRPVANDRLNALVSYTYLYDLPGADQVNRDGDVAGPKQRSHILNAALSYDLNQQFTLGAKYGFRFREAADRGTDTFVSSVAHLGVLRLDYHVVHNWDLLGEVRAMAFPDTDTTELGALLGVYRDVNDTLRLGAGYSWGGVSDDLRSIERNREGVFVNLIAKF